MKYQREEDREELNNWPLAIGAVIMIIIGGLIAAFTHGQL